MKMKIYVVELESYPANHRNDVAKLLEILDVDLDTNKPEEELLETAAQIVEDRRYWVYRTDSGGRCELTTEINGTLVAIISVASEVRPVWEGDRLVMWKARCPYCGHIFEIDPEDVSPSASDPIEWTAAELSARCEECRTKKVPPRFWRH